MCCLPLSLNVRQWVCGRRQQSLHGCVKYLIGHLLGALLSVLWQKKIESRGSFKLIVGKKQKQKVQRLKLYNPPSTRKCLYKLKYQFTVHTLLPYNVMKSPERIIKESRSCRALSCTWKATPVKTHFLWFSWRVSVKSISLTHFMVDSTLVLLSQPFPLTCLQ